MYCRNYTGTASCVLCREVDYTVSLFGEVSSYLFFFDLHLSGPCTRVHSVASTARYTITTLTCKNFYK